MESLFYFITVGFIYAVLYSVYFLFFRNNTNFQANRIYLLFIVPFSFLFPFINSTVEVDAQYQIILPIFEINDIATQTPGFNWNNALIYFYISVSSILLIRLIANIIKTINTISTIKKWGDNNIQPFSFFSFIHVPSNIDTKDRNAIIYHEKVHSTQLHSLDIIIYEISKILLWWNPLLWMGLNSVKSNHEFIADKLASVKADKYSSVLVAQLLGVNCSTLANNFKSKHLLKKRIMMMKTKKSNKLSLTKYALVIPILGLTFLATAQNQEILKDFPEVLITEAPVLLTQDDLTAPPAPPESPAPPAFPSSKRHGNEIDVKPEFKGGSEALIKYMGSHVKYPEEAKKNKIEGIVYVTFIVDSKGNTKDIKVLRPINLLLDNEAIRVVKSMPNWTPGRKDKKNISAKVTLPISFKLKQ